MQLTNSVARYSAGDDDIFWVNQLQAALIQKGYHCGEEETEDFVFGHDTESALMTFQVWALSSATWSKCWAVSSMDSCLHCASAAAFQALLHAGLQRAA